MHERNPEGYLRAFKRTKESYFSLWLRHFELFHVGQARLIRYPIHFHFDKDFNYRAEKYGVIDPQAGFSNSYLKSIFLVFLKNQTKTAQSQLTVFPSIMLIVDF